MPKAFLRLCSRLTSSGCALTEQLHIDLGILLEPISVMMLVVITTVSLMVHIYSMGYMHGEKGFQRYYAFLSLFSFSMLGLVVATNIFQMYIFWSWWVYRPTCLSDSTIRTCCGIGFEESLYRYPFCRPGLPDRYPYPLVLPRRSTSRH